MARARVELPEKFIFTTDIPLRISDINYGGHLGHDSTLTITHEARVRFFKEKGFTEMDIGGFGIMLSDVVIVYKNESFYGDTLHIKIGISNIHTYGCDIVYLLKNKEKNEEVSRVKTGIIFFDYRKRKVVRIPETFKSILIY